MSFDWWPELAVFHGGSNEENLAYIMLQPQRDFALVLMTNVSGTKADEAPTALAQELCGRFASARLALRSPTVLRLG